MRFSYTKRAWTFGALAVTASYAMAAAPACRNSSASGASSANPEDSPQPGATSAGPGTLRTRVVVPTALGTQPLGLGTSQSALSGQNVATGLEELSYAIRGISICKNMEIVGSGFSNPQDCLSIYDGAPVSSLEYDPTSDLTSLAATARTVDEPFVDLIAPAGRARLSTTRVLTVSDVREYQYGYVTWYPPIKVKASVPVSGGPTLRTRDGTTARAPGSGTGQYLTTSSATFASDAPAERAVVLLSNGGNWFKFQRPLVITYNDVAGLDAGADAAAGGGGFDLDLVFDPEALVAGFTSDVQMSSRVSLVDSAGAGFSVPMIDLAPIVRTPGKSAVAETWVADLGGGFGYRLTLFGVDPDPTRSVYGVLSRMIMTGPNVSAMDWFDAPKVSGVTADADGALALNDASGRPVVRGLRRPSGPPSPGATITAELRCTGHDESPMPNGFFLPGCATGTWRTVTFTAR